MRRVFGDAMISLCAVLLLLLMLVSIDPRVREQLSGVWTSSGASAVTGVTSQVRSVSSVVMSAARDHSIDNAPLMIFALAATVLVLFMLRT
jgi:hypothetical protein